MPDRGDHNLYAINPNGTLKWSYTVGDISGSLAIAADGTVYVGSWDHKLYAINPNGTLKWSYTAGDTVYSPAVGTDGTIYAGSYDHNLYAINPNGTLKWSYATGDTIGSLAIATDGTIYAGSDDRNLYAINPNGTLKWSYEASDVIYSPAIGSDGTIYAGSNNSLLYAINPNGTPKWGYYLGFYTVSGTPAVGADGVIYVGAGGCGLLAINPNGTPKWVFENNLYNRYASPAIGSDGVVYAGGDKLYAISSTSTGLANSSWPMAHHDAQRTGRLPGSSSSVWLTVSKPGTGSGAVTSTPSGINCGNRVQLPVHEGCHGDPHRCRRFGLYLHRLVHRGMLGNGDLCRDPQRGYDGDSDIHPEYGPSIYPHRRQIGHRRGHRDKLSYRYYLRLHMQRPIRSKHHGDPHRCRRFGFHLHRLVHRGMLGNGDLCRDPQRGYDGDSDIHPGCGYTIHPHRQQIGHRYGNRHKFTRRYRLRLHMQRRVRCHDTRYPHRSGRRQCRFRRVVRGLHRHGNLCGDHGCREIRDRCL